MGKKVGKFLYIVILKLLEGPKKEPMTVETSENRNSFGDLIKLLKLMYTSIRDAIKRNSKKSKDVNLKEIKSKKTRKTWARVKQDIKEWYDALIAEYDAKQNPEPPLKEIKEEEEIEIEKD